MSDLFGKLRAINEQVKADDLKSGDLIIYEGKLRRLESFYWNRPCGWWVASFTDDSEEHHIYDTQTLTKVSLVLDLV
jgi:hypothetical protein